VLGNRHRRIGGLPAQQRWRIGRRDHDDRTFKPGLTQVILDELPHLPPALADESQHRDIARGMACQHGEQAGFADAGPGEQPETLSLPAGRETVEGSHPDIEARAEPGARRRIGRLATQVASDRPMWQRSLPVQRPAQRIQHPAEPAIGDRQLARGGLSLRAEMDASRAARAESIK
jgi:hypothetical protein